MGVRAQIFLGGAVTICRRTPAKEFLPPPKKNNKKIRNYDINLRLSKRQAESLPFDHVELRPSQWTICIID